MQVFAVCIWRLLTLVRRGSVFSEASFRYVDVVIGAFVAASLLALALGVLLAPGDVAPGMVGLICGASLVLGVSRCSCSCSAGCCGRPSTRPARCATSAPSWIRSSSGGEW
ncbi:DUF2975 domain-containing protein [Tessaracoccus coleopterorum]|uniref:DUF2975 domain-containing protein n=1 Tax=Tessaracoccus coleopterorum TaxID=2714950 RepID=UPI001E31CFC4|nr:DUF2975 domain-containing protein [Tessaracoccus coleopterorum]